MTRPCPWGKLAGMNTLTHQPTPHTAPRKVGQLGLALGRAKVYTSVRTLVNALHLSECGLIRRFFVGLRNSVSYVIMIEPLVSVRRCPGDHTLRGFFVGMMYHG